MIVLNVASDVCVCVLLVVVVNQEKVTVWDAILERYLKM